MRQWWKVRTRSYKWCMGKRFKISDMIAKKHLLSFLILTFQCTNLHTHPIKTRRSVYQHPRNHSLPVPAFRWERERNKGKKRKREKKEERDKEKYHSSYLLTFVTSSTSMWHRLTMYLSAAGKVANSAAVIGLEWFMCVGNTSSSLSSSS